VDNAPFKEGEVVFPMKDKASVSVVIGQPSGLRESDPDWLPLTVGTDVLGSGFISRLMGNVRDREGLTYGIGAKLDDDSYRPGVWFIQGTFAPSLLDKGIASTQRELMSWWKNGISADELAYRKTSIAGKFLIGLETTSGLANALLDCVESGFDLTHLDEFPAKVNALTLDEVNVAIKKYIDPSKLALIKAGTMK
jgi:zinc protease